MKKIAILGGGIGGVEAAISPEGSDFRSLSYQIGIIYSSTLCRFGFRQGRRHLRMSLPLSDLAKVHGFDLIIDEVVGINAKDSIFVLSKNGSVKYEYLIIALGSKSFI